jgi:DNA-binding transcriptional MerR regulator
VPQFGRVDSTCQADGRIRVGKRVNTINQNRWRPSESRSLGLLDGINLLESNNCGVLAENDVDSVTGLLPIRAPIKVLHNNVHVRTPFRVDALNLYLPPHWKVKGESENENRATRHRSEHISQDNSLLRTDRSHARSRKNTNRLPGLHDDAKERLQFIRSAQRAGLTLTEIRGIIDVRADGDTPCEHVLDLIDDKLASIDARMAALEQTRTELTRLKSRSADLDPQECEPGSVCQIIYSP